MRSDLLGESVPDLEQGVTLLTTPKYRSGGLQQLIVSHLVDGQTRQAWWVDSANAFSTILMYEFAPGEHVL
ncbi:hypothetical protein HUG10_19740 (plasmid) [Halorarum halophilum]|uniref:Uncharacterized protein n=1 Tax=Halorarum halophilum TaxID=2743090 RepID=A0A7D5GEJ3_9EURY|nr:hypothetical protein [Halobaculum halophilum]QLG29845.1 hypothetical protein HUG10_19740 [Halobaculum halophilum]